MLRPRSVGLMLALLTLLVYLPVIKYQFINFDDQSYVSENQIVQNGLTWAGIKWAFTGAHASNWHPLTWLSHMADCELFHLNPAGHHLINALIHACNAALLFVLLFQLTKQLWSCAFIAALFAWHPLHVESVAWISERKDVLSTFFSLLTLLSYAKYVQKNCKRDYWLALFFFALALFSKPMPVTLPLVMLLLDYWPLKRLDEKQLQNFGTAMDGPINVKFWLSMIWEKWPFLLLTVASCVITYLAQHDALSDSLTPLLRAETALTAYGGYLWKMIWPVDLIIFYPLHWHIPWQSMAASAIILAGVSIIAWRERKICPWLIVGWLWYLITLVPVIGLVQVGSQAMADRYTYFPLIGIFLAITSSGQALIARWPFLKTCFSAAAVLILVACLALTEVQLGYWSDSYTLFSHALKVTPSEPGYLCVGSALKDQNRDSEAMTAFIMAWRLNSNSELANGSIGAMLNEEGKTELAAKYYQKALRNGSTFPSLYNNYGIILAKLNRYDEALSQYSTAVKLDPTSPIPHVLMGDLMLQKGDDGTALRQFRMALQLNESDYELTMFVANLLAASADSKARNGEEARALAERLLEQIGEQQPVALDALAMADAELGRFDEAEQLQQKAVHLVEVNGPKEDLPTMQKRLESYRKHEPWRESFKLTPTPEKLNPR